MYPTFNNKDKVVVSKISKSLNHLKSGDVIVFHQNSNNDFIKRLIGKPGDQIEYKMTSYISIKIISKNLTLTIIKNE